MPIISKLATGVSAPPTGTGRRPSGKSWMTVESYMRTAWPMYELSPRVPAAQGGARGRDRRDRRFQSTSTAGGPYFQLGEALEGGRVPAKLPILNDPPN